MDMNEALEQLERVLAVATALQARVKQLDPHYTDSAGWFSDNGILKDAGEKYLLLSGQRERKD